MNIEQLRDYCISKPQVTEAFPFDENTLVFKVAGKMFLLTGLKSWENAQPAVNLKCDPEYAIQLREDYESIVSGYHMHKKHWNTVSLYKGELTPQFIKQLIDHSYKMVVQGLPKKVRETLEK